MDVELFPVVHLDPICGAGGGLGGEPGRALLEDDRVDGILWDIEPG